MAQTTDIPSLDGLLCFNTYALNRAFGRFYQQAFGETGLTYPKYVVLVALFHNGRMSIGQLSAQVGVETNTLSPLLKRMADYGIVSRSRAEDDERRVDVGITDKGRHVLTEASKVVMEGFAAIGLDLDKVTRAVSLLTEARAKVEATAPPRLSLFDQSDEERQ